MSKTRTQTAMVKAFAIAMGRRPFTYRNVMDALGCNKSRAIIAMSELRKLGMIELISKPREGIYRLVPAKTEEHDEDWTPKAEKLQEIGAAMQPGKPYTTGELAQLTGIPITTVGRYLKALVYMGVVAPLPVGGQKNCYYRTINGINPATIPTWDACKNILSQLKASWAETEADDAEARI